MRPKLPSVMVLGLVLLSTALPVLAHHSVLAEYDSKKPVVLKGVIARVLWINPHTFGMWIRKRPTVTSSIGKSKAHLRRSGAMPR